MKFIKVAVLMIALTLLLPSVMALQWRSNWYKVDPILECVKFNSKGNYTAYFGYHNSHWEPITIPLGYFNRFSESPFDRGQTTVFESGRVVSNFSVNFDGSPIVWVLNEIRVTASNESRGCHTGGSGGSGSSGSSQSSGSDSGPSSQQEDGPNDIEEDPEGNESGDDESQESDEDIPNAPEYTTVGAALVLVVSGMYIYRKRKSI